jgi:hypothetical protein
VALIVTLGQELARKLLAYFQDGIILKIYELIDYRHYNAKDIRRSRNIFSVISVILCCGVGVSLEPDNRLEVIIRYANYDVIDKERHFMH